MTYKDLKVLRDNGISYSEQAEWIGISRQAVSLAIKKEDPNATIPSKWQDRITKKMQQLEALIYGYVQE